jgi:hypothetical protein
MAAAMLFGFCLGFLVGAAVAVVVLLRDDD